MCAGDTAQASLGRQCAAALAVLLAVAASACSESGQDAGATPQPPLAAGAPAADSDNARQGPAQTEGTDEANRRADTTSPAVSSAPTVEAPVEPWPARTVSQMPSPTGQMYELSRGRRTERFHILYSPRETNLIGFAQECTVPEAGNCCALRFIVDHDELEYRGITFPPDEFVWDHFLDPGSPFVGGVIEGPFSEYRLYGEIIGMPGCRHSAPVSLSVDKFSSIANADLSGQLVEHAGLTVQLIGGRHYLRDVSRRAVVGLGGWMGTHSAIVAQQWHDFYHSVYRQAWSWEGDVSYVAADGDPDTPLVQRAADALAYTQLTYDFFATNFSLNGHNHGGTMAAVVEAPSPRFDITGCNGGTISRGSSFNAFYGLGKAHFTPLVDPRGRGYVATLSASVDVVAHEWGHAYLNGMADLDYSRESGALNEAFADWTGVAISANMQVPEWRIGDEVFPEGHAKPYFRDLSEPRSLGDSQWRPIDEQSCERPGVCNDYCWVHYNNAIPNYMFYLLVEGGSHTPVGGSTAIAVTGIGLERAYRIAFAANQSFWTRTNSFVESMSGMLMAARTLYPDDPNIERQVALAWTAVGVGDAPTTAMAAAVGR